MDEQTLQLHFEIEEKHWWFRARRRIVLELVKGLVAPSRDALALEVGCGTGGNLVEFAKHYRVAGCDTSAEAIGYARRKLPGVELAVGSAPADVREWTRSAKVVLLLDVLEHVEDDRALLRDLLGGMSKGAFLVITVPAQRKLWSPHDEAFGHLRRYELPEFRELIAGQGGACRLTSYFCSRLYPLIRASRWATRSRGRALGREGTDFWMPGPVLNGWLNRIFAGELGPLEKAMRRGRTAYSAGSSLIGIVER
jgi:SAM-dependent methyltransferase